jgi:methyl-CpG-binding domain protein 4
MPVKPGWVPPASPYGLIQESLFPDEWAILVSCMLLNCTTRKQVEKVLPEFRRRWPGPRHFMEAPVADIIELCRPLGFANRRTVNLRRMTEAYMAGGWSRASQLPGIGEYGARAHEIFCQGIVGTEPPQDHALAQYHAWLVSGSGL